MMLNLQKCAQTLIQLGQNIQIYCLLNYKQQYRQYRTSMSNIYGQGLEKYSNPEIIPKSRIKINYEQMYNFGNMSNVNLPSNFDRTCYPTSGKHTRFPTLINCDDCNDLTMTDIEYDHGFASYLWCLVLLPCFCTGFCCLCLNSCKDVKHFCSKCRKDKGVCKSDCI